jgi:hypothetical protein
LRETAFPAVELSTRLIEFVTGRGGRSMLHPYQGIHDALPEEELG